MILRILLVTLAFYPANELGGPIKVVFENAQELVRRGHQVTVACTNRLNKRSRISPATFRDIIDGLPITYFNTYLIPGWPGVLGPSLSLDIWRQLPSLMGEVDVLHINGTRGEIFLAAASISQQIGIPYVIQPHGDVPHLGASVLIKRIYDRLFWPRLANGASAFIALTPSERQQCLAMGVPAGKIHVIPNGISGDLIGGILPGRFRQQFDLRPDDRVILFLGRIHRKKGVDILVRSFAQMKEVARLVIVGPDDGHLSQVRHLVEEFGIENRVLFTGAISGDDVYSAFRDANIFALTCRTDTFPMTLVEAASLGVPIVLAETCEISHLFADDAASIVPLDPQRIAAELDRLVSNESLCQHRSRRAREVAERCFSIKAVGDQLEALYQLVIGV